MKLIKIKDIKRQHYKGNVYDLEVGNSHTYNIEGLIVGNCSGGLHGVGTKAVNALSKLFIATVKRNGKIYQQKFSEGRPITEVEVIGTCDINDTGTEIEYHPDPTIFKITVEPNCKDLQNRIDELASLNAGIKVIYTNEITGFNKEYHYEDGIVGYTKRLLFEKNTLYDDPFYIKGDYKLDNGKIIMVEVTFIHDDEEKASETIKSFANNINTYEGGFHLQGFRNEYRKQINELAISNKLTANSIELKYLLDGIYAIISVKVPEAEFEGQTKTKLGNSEAQDAVEEIVRKEFKRIIANKDNLEIIETIITRAVKVKEAEEAARKARANARKANKTSKMALPGKLADCSNKNGYTEIFVVEGDSAAGCWAYDTKIKLLDGRELEIGKAVEEFKQGKINYVYSSDENGKIFIQPIIDAFKTKTNTQVIQLTLDNNQKIKCTPEHKIMLRDGTYKEAQYLTKEDSLMPLYMKIKQYEHSYYDTIYNEVWIKDNYTNKYEPVYRKVANQYYGEKELSKKIHTHHIDFNPENNNPENIQYITAGEHSSIHGVNKFDFNCRIKISKKVKQCWKNDDFGKWRAEKTREQMNNPESRQKKKETMTKNRINKGLNIINSMINNNIEVNKINYSNIRKTNQNSKFIAKWEFLLDNIGTENEVINQAKTYNHKVISIEWLEEKEDVYDITVPPYSNFALTAGIFVHNSAKSGRYREFQAILPLKGKVLNTEKADFEKMMKAESVTNIIAAMGAGVGENFDVKKCRYDKFIIMCFTGDTKLKSLDGKNYSFEELIKNDVKELWVYSRNENGEIIPAKAINPRITGYTKELCHVELDNGEVIKCTPNHLFLTKDNEYIEAQYLTEDISLSPLYLSNNETGHLTYYNDNETKWTTVHSMVNNHINQNEKYKYNELENDYLITHHKDFNKLNNNPENLLWIPFKEHFKYHGGKQIDQLIKYNKSDKHKDKTRQLHKEGIFKNWSQTHNGSEKHINTLVEMNKKYAGERITKYNKTDNNRNSTKELNKREDVKLLQQQGKIAKIIKQVIKNNDVFNECNYETIRKTLKGGQLSWSNIIKYFDSYEIAYEYSLNYNHNIKSVEIIKLDKEIPVYDITVPETHNFALNSGVFVHNCDADDDGAHIKSLLLTLIYNYMRPLLENEMVYVTMPPLYRVVKNKQIIYLKGDHELKEFKRKNPSSNFTIQRFKGLTRCLALIPFSA